MSLWSWVNPMSAYAQPLKHLPADDKCARITPINHGASDHGRTRAQVREPVEIDIVKNSRTVRCQRLVAEFPEFLVTPVLRTQARGNRKDLLARRWRHQNLHANKI